MQKIFEEIGCRRNNFSPIPLLWISQEALLSNDLSESIGILAPEGDR